MKRSTIVSIIAAILIVLWVYAALSKMLDFKHSRSQMLNQVFPIAVSKVLLWAVPAIELLTSILLLFTKTRLHALCFSSLLLLGFSGYIVLVMSNTFSKIPCSCGGIMDNFSWEEHLAFNLVFLCLALLGTFYELKERRLACK